MSVLETKHLSMLDMLSEDTSINSQGSDMWSHKTLCGQKKCLIRLMKLWINSFKSTT